MCLMICSKILSYFPTSTYDLNPKPNSVLPILSIRRHRVSLVISHCQTLISSVSPMGSRSHRDGLANSLLPIAIFSVPPRYAIGPTEFAWPTLCLLFAENGLTEFKQSVSPRWGFALALAHWSHRVDHVGSTEIPDVNILNWIGLTEFHYSVSPSLVIYV